MTEFGKGHNLIPLLKENKFLLCLQSKIQLYTIYKRHT